MYGINITYHYILESVDCSRCMCEYFTSPTVRSTHTTIMYKIYESYFMDRIQLPTIPK